MASKQKIIYDMPEKPVKGVQWDGTTFPNIGPEHKSYMAKHLTQRIWDRYTGVESNLGVTLAHCIKTGVDSPHLGQGITAGDESCYETFKDIFYPVIQSGHGYDAETQIQISDLNAKNLKFSPPTKALFNKYVKSTRIRAARSLRGYFLPSSATREHRLKVQETLKNIFETKFKDELKGTYYALGDLNPQETQFLRENGFLFQMPSKRNCLYFSGAARDWPEGRGIFHNKNKTFLAWVNEEDHCRLISMSKDGDVLDVFSRFCKAAEIFSQNAEIMRSDALGFIGTCPSNLGTGLRASVMVVLPKFTESVELLESACASLDLQPRGSTGEHTAAVGGKWDISNKRRIGFSEVQLVQIMVDGVRQIINWEEMLVDGQQEEVKRQIWEIKGKWREPLRDEPLNENGA